VTPAGPPLPLTTVASDPWLLRFRIILVSVLGAAVAGIACLAFYTSFEAIRAFAMRSDGIAPEHAWAIPLLVDSFIVVATGADLWFVTTGKYRAWWEVLWPKLLLGGAASVSFILNVAHAEHSWAARGVAAIPPAALVLGVELLMMVLRRASNLRISRLEHAERQAKVGPGLPGGPQLPALPLPVELTRTDGGQPAARNGERAAELAAVAAADGRNGEQEQRPAAAPVPAAAAAATPATSERDTPPVQDQQPATTARTAAPSTNVVLTDPTRKRGPVVVEAGSELAPRTAAPLAASAGLGSSGIVRRSGKAPAPFAVASRILAERKPGETMTAETLLAALGNKGITVDLNTARRLLRELRPATSPGNGRPSRIAPADGDDGTAPAAPAKPASVSTRRGASRPAARTATQAPKRTGS
jgi:hypothetical protein